MGTEFPAMCSKFPCKSGENKTPLSPSGTRGIKEPWQFWMTPICCKKNPAHIAMSMSVGAIKAFKWKVFFNIANKKSNQLPKQVYGKFGSNFGCLC